jgi:hypothetical protein
VLVCPCASRAECIGQGVEEWDEAEAAEEQRVKQSAVLGPLGACTAHQVGGSNYGQGGQAGAGPAAVTEIRMEVFEWLRLRW